MAGNMSFLFTVVSSVSSAVFGVYWDTAIYLNRLIFLKECVEVQPYQCLHLNVSY